MEKFLFEFIVFMNFSAYGKSSILRMSQLFTEIYILDRHSQVPQNIKLYKTDKAILEDIILHLSLELNSVDIKMLKFPMCVNQRLADSDLPAPIALNHVQETLV